ncbi:aldo/keto reductase [Marinomonas sp. SM2066]|uniref:Aldo/keto reductase n=1 Tax=Marinomonas colpomeniae TaxID=2774408 RepID=A0ABR8NXU8_9GAMM|nr:aldo/keto reductase [Marinomonas colpomeniae]
MNSSGSAITELGFGSAGAGNLFRPVSYDEITKAINKAHSLGIQYFDTAPHYGAGLAERRLGVALDEMPRADIFLSTKVGRVLHADKNSVKKDADCYVEASPFDREYDYTYDGIMRSFEDSLQRLGVSSIDMLLMHDIGELTHKEKHQYYLQQAIDGGFKAMAELREQGAVRNIGLGVNEWQICDQAMEYAQFDCFMVANCFTLLNNDITDYFTDKCSKNQVSLIAAAPFNSGILAKGSKGLGHYFYGEAPQDIVKKVIAIEGICEQFNVSLQAAAIQYALRYDCVKSILIGMTNESRVAQNIAWYEEDIPEAFWLSLADVI